MASTVYCPRQDFRFRVFQTFCDGPASMDVQGLNGGFLLLGGVPERVYPRTTTLIESKKGLQVAMARWQADRRTFGPVLLCYDPARR